MKPETSDADPEQPIRIDSRRTPPRPPAQVLQDPVVDPATDGLLLKPPRLLWLASETRALLEYGWYLQSLLWLRTLPRGDGHPVLVLPGFTTGDSATGPLRRFLRRRGYRSFPWRQGLNLGLNDALEVRMIRRLRDVHYRHGRKVSIIGWSLGGIYARELARQQPDCVRQVITLGSPFNLSPRANHAWRLYERFAGEQVEAHKDRMAGLEEPLPVPSTAVYTRTDGIVAWQCCLQNEGPQSENVEIYGSHCGLGHNPMALYVIADRLAQPEGDWSPFDRSGLRRLFFRDAPTVEDALAEGPLHEPGEAVERRAEPAPAPTAALRAAG